jgi:membrane-bound metal-dependent hydrolase YbcI (DUF457 family)
MFLGHFGVALAAKKVAPRPSLGTLVLAALLVDTVWPVMLLSGWEQVEIVPGYTAASPLRFVYYPWTHSLVATLGWAALLAGGYFVLRRERNGAFWLALLVLSHWVLDWVSHRPDLPLWPGSARFGLGLWDSLSATLAVEVGLLAFGTRFYLSATRPRDAVGRYALWAFVTTLAVIYIASVVGPPPPSVAVLAWSGLLGWGFIAWAYWIDRHRAPVAIGAGREPTWHTTN